MAESIGVLLVDDDQDWADILIEKFGRGPGASLEMEHVDSLSSALERVGRGGVDVVLLDLTLPDSRGMDTVLAMRQKAPDVPFIVLTGLDDESFSSRAVREGAQDYLSKQALDRPLLERSIRYAMERHRLAVELGQYRQREQQERELRTLAHLSGPGDTPVTSRVFGVLPLRESAPELFASMVDEYGKMMDLALEQRAYRVEHDLSAQLRSMAGEIGFMGAGPRDVVQIHSAALKRKIDGAAQAKAETLIEEGRIMVLELMGHLASYYRQRSNVEAFASNGDRGSPLEPGEAEGGN